VLHHRSRLGLTAVLPGKFSSISSPLHIVDSYWSNPPRLFGNSLGESVAGRFPDLLESAKSNPTESAIREAPGYSGLLASPGGSRFATCPGRVRREPRLNDSAIIFDKITKCHRFTV
jgi:hypothetical protein